MFYKNPFHKALQWNTWYTYPQQKKERKKKKTNTSKVTCFYPFKNSSKTYKIIENECSVHANIEYFL